MLYQFNFITGIFDINEKKANEIKKDIEKVNTWIKKMKELLNGLGLYDPIFDTDGIPRHMRDEFDRLIMKDVCKIVEKHFIKELCVYVYEPISDELEMYEAKIIKLEES